MKIRQEKFNDFINELKSLEDKYGIYISSDYEEEIDYNWEEEPYVIGVSSYVIFVDDDGNTITYPNNLHTVR